ncbi:response regulator [Tundrisphaera sp. TA3]|uniref:response regulator n=1 Tax=Tundrisphaera sp. TA3 TaxID=3435775 RepID=UPI003EC0E28D
MGPIRIIIADDHRLLRAGLRALLEDLPGVEVVAEAGDGLEALAFALELRPDVMLTDISMPRLGGLEVVARLARERPEVRVLILSMHREEEYVRRAVLAGAAGYLIKDSSEEELAAALAAVARGETYLSPAASTHLVSDYRRRAAGDCDPTAGLTPRQVEVLRMIAEGATTKAIARRMGISAKTVESHREQLMGRLGIRDVPGLVKLAIRAGLVASD